MLLSKLSKCSISDYNYLLPQIGRSIHWYHDPMRRDFNYVVARNHNNIRYTIRMKCNRIMYISKTQFTNYIPKMSDYSDIDDN